MKKISLIEVSYFIGFIPIVLTTTIFLGWILTKSETLVAAGVIITYLNALLILIAILCIFFFVNISNHNTTEKKVYKKKAIVSCIIILLNFPIHLVYALMAIKINNRVYVTLINESSRSLNNITLKAGGDEKIIKNMEKDTKRSIYLSPRFDDEIELRFSTDKNIKIFTAGYVTPNLGGHYLIKIDSSVTTSFTTPPRFFK